MKLISGIVDSGFFAQSALSAEVATKDSLGRNISETYLTAVDIPESANWNSTYNTVHDNSASWTGGTANPQIPVTGINGIKISESADQVVFEVSANYATEDWVTAQGYITNDSITGKQDITGMTAYATVESLTAKQDAGDYLSASDSANFLLTSDSANFYPSDNPSAFITGVDLTPYQLTADMTAYMTTADSTNFYTTANESGFITGVPDTYLQNTDLSTTDGKVTAISGIPLSAGGDVPEGVMVESGLEYNAVNEISAYNGSAIAQYGAEKQFIVHDDTLCHLSNSAQFALGVNISAVAQLLGIDETVLWSGELSVGQTAALTENYSAFRKLEFKYRPWSTADNGQMKYEQFGSEHGNWQTLAGWMKNNLKAVFIGAYSAKDANHITLTSACFNNITATNAWANAADNYRLFEIRGIGRKS